MKILKFILLIVVINYLFAMIYSVFSPACYSSPQIESLRDLPEYLLASLQLLLIWLISIPIALETFFANVAWALAKAHSVKDLIFYFPSALTAVLLVIDLIIIIWLNFTGKWQSLRGFSKYLLILFVTLCINSILLDSWCMAMRI